MSRASDILGSVSEGKSEIIKNSKGEFYIKKGGTIYDPVTKSWIKREAFVHSDDWKGVVFQSKIEAEKVLSQI